MSDLNFTIEAMRPPDTEAVERLHARAFGPGRFARTAFRIREEAGEGAGLAFVARVGSLLVGAVQLTPVHLGLSSAALSSREPVTTSLENAGVARAFMLGPLTVDPPFEGRGIGRALLQRCEDAARALKSDMILLVGDEPYYRRAGYVRVPMGRITLPGPVDPMRLLALELKPGILKEVQGQVRGGAHT